MDDRLRKAGQLGYPAPDVVAFGVKLLSLGGGIEDPDRPDNKPAGEARLSFPEEMGWNLYSWQICTSAESGTFTPYELPTDEEIAELERAELEDANQRGGS